MANWNSSSLLNQHSFLSPSLLKTVTFWSHKWLFIYSPIKCVHGPKSQNITFCSIHKCSTHYYKLLDHLIFFASSFFKKRKYSQSPNTSLKYKTIKIIVIIMICLLGLLWHRKQMPADLYCRDMHIASWYTAESVSSLPWGCSVWVENVHLFFRIRKQLQESEDEAALFLLWDLPFKMK